MKLEYGVVTDIGKKREINEDSLLVLSKDRAFVVADGMGGHYGGEIASNLAVDTLKKEFEKHLKELDLNDMKITVGKLDQMINAANKAIINHAKKSSFNNDMGTTVVGAVFFENTAMTFHVGDSRAYLFRENELFQVSVDHSWINEQLRFNKLSTKEARAHKWKNVIMRALGTKKVVLPEYNYLNISNGDIFVFCSDGLSDMVNDKMIKRIIEKNQDEPQEATNKLLEEALRKGGLDNITIILVKVL
ncbi:Stp1/IreP family PP2C-type Ser/Thr phosphatase [bacterium]|nr:Stp1/IreP family PP2C-type Ser/Thr phosphatase [bacterium]